MRERSSPSLVSGYFVAVVATALVALARFVLGDVLGDTSPYLPFIVPVMLAGRYGGLKPALSAAFLGGVLSVYLFTPPTYSSHLNRTGDVMGIAVFFACGVTISWLCESLHAAHRRLEAKQRRMERQASERQKAHHQITSLMDNTPLAVVEADHNYVITRWSGQAEKIFGWTAAEVVGKHALSLGLVYEEDMPKVERVIERQRDPENRYIISPVRNRAKDGRVIFCEWYSSTLHDASGRMVAVLSLALDVTERKRAEETLRAKEAELELIISETPLLLTRCSRDHRYVFVNRACAEFLGWPPEEIIGRRIPDVMGEEAFATITPYVERVLSGERVEFETEIPYANAGRRFMLVTYAPDRNERGDIIGWLASISDVTDLKQAQEALKGADRRKSEFLAVLSHELRNPLAPIRNAAEILRRAGPPEPGLQMAREIIVRQAEQMARLIDDLLDINRINQNKLQLRRSRVELATVFQNAIEISRPLIEAAGHELTINLPPAPVYLSADPIRLAQVFSNLLNNAAKYTERAGHIWFTAERRNGEVEVSVRDTGVGIASEQLPNIFEMFSQVESALERSQGGLGIGLSLARGLVELHGGRIEARSPGVGRGSEFIISLPIPAQQPAEESPAASAAGPPVNARKRRALVVDDNLDSAESCALLLRIAGHDVRLAHDGLEAVEAASAFLPDVVVMDIGLPKLDGYEAARRIRELPTGRQMILVAVTGWGQEDDKRRSRAAGFDYHLVKPVDPDELEKLMGASPSAAL